MSEKRRLTELARKRMNEEKIRAEAMFSESVQEALRLAEQFDSIKPQVFLMPLDELAGFITSRNKNENNAC